MDFGMDGSQGTVQRYLPEEVESVKQPELRKVCGKENLPMKQDGKFLGVSFLRDQILALHSAPGATDFQRYDPWADKWVTVATHYGEGPHPKKGKVVAQDGGAEPRTPEPDLVPPLGVTVKREVDTPAVALPSAPTTPITIGDSFAEKPVPSSDGEDAADGEDAVEGGGELIFSLFEAELVDELTVYVGSMIIGGRGAPTLADGDGFVDEFPTLELRDVARLDDGVVLSYDV